MYAEDYIHLFAGTLVLVSLALGYFWTPWWFLLTVFVGANLFQYGLTKFCPMALILKLFGVRPLPRDKTTGGCCAGSC
jgi:hypothetical protein